MKSRAASRPEPGRSVRPSGSRRPVSLPARTSDHGLTFALSKSVRADRSLNDTDLIAALTSLTKTWETLVNSGLHLRESDCQPCSTGGRGGSAKHGEGISRGRAEAPRIRATPRLGSAARTGLHGPHGPRPHLRTAKIARLRRLPRWPSSRRNHPESPRRKKPAAG